jgi:hypothetical protein
VSCHGRDCQCEQRLASSKEATIMTIIKVVCKTPPSGANKKVAASKADKPTYAAQETEDNRGPLGTTYQKLIGLLLMWCPDKN